MPIESNAISSTEQINSIDSKVDGILASLKKVFERKTGNDNTQALVAKRLIDQIIELITKKANLYAKMGDQESVKKQKKIVNGLRQINPNEDNTVAYVAYLLTYEESNHLNI